MENEMTTFTYYKPNENKTIVMTNGQSIMGEFIVNDDGYYVFFPSNIKGYYNEFFLQILLNKLTELNKDWDEQLNQFLKETNNEV